MPSLRRDTVKVDQLGHSMIVRWGRRRRSLIIVGSRDADERGRDARGGPRDGRTERVEKKGERDRGSWKSDPIVYAHVRKYESGRVIGLSAAFVIEPPLYFLSNCRL